MPHNCLVFAEPAKKDLKLETRVTVGLQRLHGFRVERGKTAHQSSTPPASTKKKDICESRCLSFWAPRPCAGALGSAAPKAAPPRLFSP